MRILIVHYRYFISGGPERYLFNVKKALEDRGHTVIPFSIQNSNNEKSEYSKYFVENIGKSDEVFVNKYPKTLRTYFDLINREFYSKKVKKSLQDLIKIEKPNVCYLLVYKRALSPSVIDACKEYGIPVINRISDYNTVCGAGSLYRDGHYCELCLKNDIECFRHKCVKGNKLFSLMRFLSIRYHKRLQMPEKIDDYVCTNQFMANVMEKYGYEKRKLHVIPTFFKEDDEIRSWDKSNKVNPTQVNFLFIGNIDESKGIYDLLDALGILVKQVKNFHLYVVGGLHAEENTRVQKIVQKEGLSDFITFVPFMRGHDVFKYYLKTNVTVLPTRWVENLPNTLIESIYFNRPVVVPDYGSFQYTTDEKVSFRFQALSSQSLYECLREICRVPEAISIKSQCCHEFFVKNYSEEAHMKELLKLLNRGETK